MSTLPISIAPMRFEEADAIGALEAAAFAARPRVERETLPTGMAPPYELTHADRLREELARPWSKIWVARGERGEPLGFLLAWHVVDELHVLNVATHAEFRRRGVGRALMEHAMRFAADRRARHVLLEVRRSNTPAIRLYRVLGFFALSIRRNYYSDGEDAIEMMLALDPDTGAIVPKEDEVRLADA